MKSKLLYCLLGSVVSYNLSAMEDSRPEKEFSVKSTTTKPSPQSQQDVSEKDWSALETFHLEGCEHTAKILSLSFQEKLKIIEPFSEFKSSFQDLFKLPRSTSKIDLLKTTRKTLESYAEFLILFYNAFDSASKIKTNASQNPGQSVSRERFLELYKSELKQHFLIFQRITNRLFEHAISINALNFKAEEGIFECGKLSVVFFKDSNGFVTLPYKPVKNYWMLASLWGEMDPLHQKHYLVKAGEIVKDSGFYVTSENNFVKFMGYHGEQGTYPHTSHNITARINKESAKAEYILHSLGFDNLADKKSHFIPVPTSKRDNCLLELGFIDEIIKESNVDDAFSANYQAALQTRRLLEIEYKCTLEEKKAQLEKEILSEIEEQITQEQEARKQLVITDEVHKKSKKEKKKKPTKSANKNKTTVTSPKEENHEIVDTQTQAKELFEKYKAECFMKFREVKQLLNTIAKDTETQRKFHTIINGSHINVHTDDGQGFTIVRPHGSKSEIAPSVVNRLINNALQIFLSGN